MVTAAARGSSPQSSTARHWVRGHWRNQWYPSLGESGQHRQIWIDGFVRGDESIGTIHGPRVYRAHGD